MFGNALRIGSIRGIDIRIDASWLIIAAIVTWSFWGQFAVMHGWDRAPALVMAVAAALLFFLSVLAHEVAHALEAQRRGVTVGGITLFLFGGVTESKFDVRRPIDEFSLTVVGPLTSFALAALFGAVAMNVDERAVADVAGLLGWINLALGVFNLLPGAPLDGGRILRSAVWKVTGDRRRSIRIAAQAGRVVGGALIALGLAQLLFGARGLFSGLWLALIGWFLLRGAAAELAQAELLDLFEDIPARDLVTRTEPVPPQEPVAAVLDRWSLSDAPAVLPVADQGRLVGIVAIADACSLPGPRRSSTAVEEVMVPVAELPVVGGDEPASQALSRVRQRGVVVVTDGGQPVGLIDADRLAAVAERRARTRRAPGRAPAAR